MPADLTWINLSGPWQGLNLWSGSRLCDGDGARSASAPPLGSAPRCRAAWRPGHDVEYGVLFENIPRGVDDLLGCRVKLSDQRLHLVA